MSVLAHASACACTFARVCARRCLTVAADCCAAQPRDTFLLVFGDGGTADPHLAHFTLHATLSLPRRTSAMFQCRMFAAAHTCGRWQPLGESATCLRARRMRDASLARAHCVHTICHAIAGTHQLLREGVGVDRGGNPVAIARERHGRCLVRTRCTNVSSLSNHPGPWHLEPEAGLDCTLQRGTGRGGRR